MKDKFFKKFTELYFMVWGKNTSDVKHICLTLPVIWKEVVHSVEDLCAKTWFTRVMQQKASIITKKWDQ